jgi:hypothetical protein
MLSWLITLLALYGFVLLFVVWREKSFIYFPSREIVSMPEHVQDVWLKTTDGIRVNGWFVPAETNAALTVLFCHGNAGNISHRLEKLAILRELGVNVFIFDYRGYGRSDGAPDEQGTYRDAQAAYDFLAGKTIVVYGESLGAAVAVELATKNHVAGVIIEEPFTSAVDVGQKMFPYLPVRLIARNRYDTLSKIDRINAPLLILHSRDDEFFPMQHAERLLAAAHEPKRLVELHGGHNDAFLTSAETYRAALADFLRSL